MDKDLVRLLEQISSLSDDELRRMVSVDYASYRQEAIAFAEIVMAKRGFTVSKKVKASNNRKAAATKQKELRDANDAPLQGEAKEGVKPAELNRAIKPLACPRCNAELNYVGTRQLHEEKNLSVLGELGEMFKNGAQEFLDIYTCKKCGRVELFVDGLGEDSRPY
jgi:uncharacterized protein YbaR (Trm112 family)